MTDEQPRTHAADRSVWRFQAVAGMLLLVWALLAARLVEVQWIHGGRYAAQANRQRSFVESIPARPGDIKHSLADIGLARRLLGYAPEVTLREGLRRTVESF